MLQGCVWPRCRSGKGHTGFHPPPPHLSRRASAHAWCSRSEAHRRPPSRQLSRPPVRRFSFVCLLVCFRKFVCSPVRSPVGFLARCARMPRARPFTGRLLSCSNVWRRGEPSPGADVQSTCADRAQPLKQSAVPNSSLSAMPSASPTVQMDQELHAVEGHAASMWHATTCGIRACAWACARVCVVLCVCVPVCVCVCK